MSSRSALRRWVLPAAAATVLLTLGTTPPPGSGVDPHPDTPENSAPARAVTHPAHWAPSLPLPGPGLDIQDTPPPGAPTPDPDPDAPDSPQPTDEQQPAEPPAGADNHTQPDPTDAEGGLPPAPQAARPPHCPTPLPASARDLDVIAHTPHTLAPIHAVATGTGVKVAVIDTGVAPHPRLGHIIDGGDTLTGGSGLGDCDGHGTIVAGIIAARPGPDGLLGIAPDATIISIRQSSAHTPTPPPGATDQQPGSMLTLLQAVRAARAAEADIITMSIASCVDDDTARMLDGSELAEELHSAHDDGIVLIAAAGNHGSECPTGSHVYPAAFPTVIAVSAREGSLDLAEYSMPVTGPLLSAPGTIAVGLSPTGHGLATGLSTPRGPATWTGTSFAAPFAAGVAALIKQHNPTLTATDITRILHDAAAGTTGALDPARALSLADSPPATTEPAPAPVALTAPQPHGGQVARRAQWVGAGLMGAALVGLWVWRPGRRPDRPRGGRAR